jgi:hypothetical protein
VRIVIASLAVCGSLFAAIFTGCGGDDTNASEPAIDGSTGDTTSDGAANDSGNDARLNYDAGPDTGCPAEMNRIDSFCVDRYEAYVVEVDDAGNETAHSPYDVVDGLRVRAKSAGDVFPQGYISQVEATAACAEADKRLCSPDEFSLSCRGVHADAGTPYYPYGGTTHEPGVCNEGKGSFMPLFFGSDPANWTYDDFNSPMLNEADGGLARTGEYSGCVSPSGTFDCVGNLHEWTNEPPDVSDHGRFHGGFYGDAELNGHGCLYVTSAHDVSYHDYSTGFRCCKDAAP